MKDIPGYEGLYAISRSGEIWSHYRKKIMKQSVGRKGYSQISLYNGESKTYRVHRLVMLTYAGPSDLHVNHINGNKKDNSLENLEYCTNKQNIDHAIKEGLRKNYGEKVNTSKLKEKDVLYIRSSKESNIILADKYNVDRSQISRIKNKKAWKHI